jgi:hypothetical protein
LTNPQLCGFNWFKYSFSKNDKLISGFCSPFQPKTNQALFRVRGKEVEKTQKAWQSKDDARLCFLQPSFRQKKKQEFL